MGPVRPRVPYPHPPPTLSLNLLSSLFASTSISSSSSSPCRSAMTSKCTYIRRIHHRPQANASGNTRSFATSARLAKRKPKHQSISQAELSKFYPQYTANEKTELKKQYSDDQIAAIEASETAIADEDLATQAYVRRDVLRPTYMDTFSRIEPIIDTKMSKLRGQEQAPHLYQDIPDVAEMPDPMNEMSEEVAINREVYETGQWYSEVDPATGETSWGWDNDPQYAVMRLMDEDRAGLEALRTRLASEGKLLETQEFKLPEGQTVTEYFNSLNLGLGTASDTAPPEREDSAALSSSSSDEAAEAAAASPGPDEDPLAPRQEDLGNGKIDLFNAFYNIKLKDYLAQFGGAAAFPGPLKRFRLVARDRHDLPDVAWDLPRIDDPSVRYAPTADEVGAGDNSNRVAGKDDNEERQAAYERTARAMGMTVAQMQRFRVRTLLVRFVSNQTHLGKIRSSYVLAVAGNGAGLVGIGEGKSTDTGTAADQARLNALRNMVPILRYENRTIFGRVEAKVGAVRVELCAAKPGFGLRVNRHLFEIAKCAGIKDLSGRLPRGRTPMNVCKAVWEALQSQKNPEHVAMARGRKLVDVRKVYYSGRV